MSCIFLFYLAERKEIIHKISPSHSKSSNLDFSKLINTGIAETTFSYFGRGNPLQRLQRAHALVMIFSFLWVSNWMLSARMSTVPVSIKKSLNSIESAAMLPIAQIDCSEIWGILFSMPEIS